MPNPEICELDPLTEVDLDPANPRVPEEERSDDQKALLEVMVRHFKVEELADSIAASGFLQKDPLVAYRRGDRVTVREGNRRIAALKALRDQAMLPASYRARFAELKSRMDPPLAQSLDRVTVEVYASIDDVAVDAYVGFRHVTGPLPWQPEQKARFVADMIERHHWSFREIASRLGSYPRHVERLYVAYRTLRQAREDEVPGADQISLGVLVRALQTKGVSEYLGIRYTGNPAAETRPIADDHATQLREFVLWAFGTDEKKPVLGDSRELTLLGDVLASIEAVEYLRSSESPDLEVAHRRAGGGKELVLRGFIAAAQKLEEIAAWVPEVAKEVGVEDVAVRCGRRLVTIARDVPPLAGFLREWAQSQAKSS